MKESLLDRLLKAGYKMNSPELSHYYSDLYVIKNDKTTSIIKEWIKDNNYNYCILSDPFLCETFTDNKTGLTCYSLSFQYYPYFNEHKIYN